MRNIIEYTPISKYCKLHNLSPAERTILYKKIKNGDYKNGFEYRIFERKEKYIVVDINLEKPKVEPRKKNNGQ